jgi:O6-methylguanine-DNA--protein-cysteine methyltransferase
MFFSLSKLIDMSKNNREFLFLKLTEQYKSEDGKWHYSKKNPTIRPQDIPAMIEAMHELDDYFNRGGDSEPENKGSDLPEDPFD